MARAFSLALLALWGVVRELAAIFLALRGSCGALAHDISRREHLIFLLLGPLGVFDLARVTHLAHYRSTSATHEKFAAATAATHSHPTPQRAKII